MDTTRPEIATWRRVVALPAASVVAFGAVIAPGAPRFTFVPFQHETMIFFQSAVAQQQIPGDLPPHIPEVPYPSYLPVPAYAGTASTTNTYLRSGHPGVITPGGDVPTIRYGYDLLPVTDWPGPSR
jgi:hypothetical protein